MSIQDKLRDGYSTPSQAQSYNRVPMAFLSRLGLGSYMVIVGICSFSYEGLLHLSWGLVDEK